MLLQVAVGVAVEALRDVLTIDGGDVDFAAVVKERDADKQHADTGNDDEQVGNAVSLFFADVF